MKKVFTLTLLLLCSLIVFSQVQVIYVDASAQGSNNGTSWTNAFTRLQDALAQADNLTKPLQVWVAKGTYYPDEGGGHTNNDRFASFHLRNGVAIYGGFSNIDVALYQRNWVLNKTILSGDIDKDMINDNDNSHHVVRSSDKNSTAVLDGFTITAGNGIGAYNGAGLHNENSSPTIRNCTFTGNITYADGSGMYNTGSSPTIINCRFIGNECGADGGGIANVASSYPAIINCLFSGNSAYHGGAFYNSNSDPTIINCTITGNGATEGGAIYNYAAAHPKFTNCIMWGNSANQFDSWGSLSSNTVNYSVVQGGYSGTGNLNSDPQFVNASGGDLHLKGSSPAIDAGDNTKVSTASDLDGHARIVHNRVDIGAYEYQYQYEHIIFVKADAVGNNTGSSWSDAFVRLQDALSAAVSGDTIWVAAGTYYPDEGGGMTNNDRAASFTLKNNIVTYGGFAGTETMLSQRNWNSNAAILSGDIDRIIDNTGNAYHVVTSRSVNTTAVLDGFTITGGKANATGNNCGAGMYNASSTATVVHCSFERNAAVKGGAIYDSVAAPRLSNCRFFADTANSGGAIYTLARGHYITNCSFSGNKAFTEGGGLDSYTSSDTLVNCSFWGNSAPQGGGLFAFFSTNVRLINCSFWGNTASIDGGGINNWASSSLAITNSIVWGNTGGQVGGDPSTVSYSIVQGGHQGTGNLNTDPLFINAADGDLHLWGCSPAIDAATSAGAPAFDLEGNQRPTLSGYDMGAYEFQPGSAGSIAYVNASSTSATPNGASWATAFKKLQDALNKAATCSNLRQIWVATGTYYPTGISSDRSASFILRNNLAVLGGFDGTESPHDSFMHRYGFSTLSGDIDGDGTVTGNSYHVVQSLFLDSSAVLDGFIITGGNADGDANLQNDRGGGMFNEHSYPTVKNCIFTRNNALNYGGGIFNSNTDYPPTLANCLYTRNASYHAGGAIYNIASSPRIVNCTIADNFAADKGGGIYNISRSYPTITNCILWANSNSIDTVLGARPIVSYSIVQGGYGGTNNLTTDPLFVDAAFGNLHVRRGSPAIDAGNDATIPSTITTDLDGNPRKQGLHVDMGAYEYASAQSGPGPLTLTCPASFSLESDATGCGAVGDFTDSHAATSHGGKAPVTITYAPTSGTVLPVGVNTIMVTASDSAGTTKTCSFAVTVVDTTPPMITGVTATPSLLYPPNHKMHDIGLAYTATDNCGAVITSISVEGNESTHGSGDGNTSPDWIVVDDHHLKLRAERSGTGTDRIYTITITATDAAGNTATTTTTVRVPHDNGSVTTTQKRTEPEEMRNGLKVQAIPNPTTDGFTIMTQSSFAEPLSIQVMDDLGRILEKKTGLAANGYVYLGSSYRPGMYFVEIVQGDTVRILKVIKQAR